MTKFRKLKFRREMRSWQCIFFFFLCKLTFWRVTSISSMHQFYANWRVTELLSSASWWLLTWYLCYTGHLNQERRSKLKCRGTYMANWQVRMITVAPVGRYVLQFLISISSFHVHFKVWRAVYHQYLLQWFRLLVEDRNLFSASGLELQYTAYVYARVQYSLHSALTCRALFVLQNCHIFISIYIFVYKYLYVYVYI